MPALAFTVFRTAADGPVSRGAGFGFGALFAISTRFNPPVEVSPVLERSCAFARSRDLRAQPPVRFT
jgi:hypothetical protein